MSELHCACDIAVKSSLEPLQVEQIWEAVHDTIRLIDPLETVLDKQREYGTLAEDQEHLER